VDTIYAHSGTSEPGNKSGLNWQDTSGQGRPDQPGADGLAIASILAVQEKRSAAAYATSESTIWLDKTQASSDGESCPTGGAAASNSRGVSR
jgi:hypothetical protein